MSRVIAWFKPEPLGVEFADVALAGDHLYATGVAIGSLAAPYRLDYQLETSNTMPVLRHGLLAAGGPLPLDFTMAWVSVPDLAVRRSLQRYTFLRNEAGNAIVRYESRDSDFTADLAFDSDGVVIDYPGIGRAIG